jgi:DNA mismatch repair ATPase MutL
MMFDGCESYRWARETLRNSLDAGATKVEFGIESQAEEKYNVYRRTIIDNGSGMNREDAF